MRTELEMSKKRWRLYRLTLWVVLFFSIGTIGAVMAIDIYRTVPDTIYLKAGEESEISLHVPLSGEIVMTAKDKDRAREAISDVDEAQGKEDAQSGEMGEDTDRGTGEHAAGYDADALEREADGGVAISKISIDLSGDVTLVANAENTYRAELKLFGLIPFKTVQIEVIDESMVYPAGLPIGIYVKTPGVLVIGTSDFLDENGNIVMPSEHVLRVGDYILSVNGSEVTGKRDFVERVAKSEGSVMVMTVERGGRQFDIAMRPVRNQDREYKLGIWIKDSAQGIGTLTYVDADGNFGALGHAVSDSDIGIMLQLSDGALYRTDIIGITKGKRGVPGELTGIIRYTDSNCFGSVTENTVSGIHGQVNAKLMEQIDSEPVEIGLKQEVHVGAAQIYCNIDGEARYYDIEIVSLDYDSANVNKGITLRVTDQKLINLTGGIVQGMSGSPILQNGKMIGAVTHVLVNDAQRGYGIFIENMLQH